MRKLAAIMFTDIVGYTALMSQDEEKALQLLQHNRELLKPLIRQFRGEWLKEIGDGTLSCFASAVDAVNCALVIQRTLKDDPDLSLRIGIHVGDVVFEEGDVFGDGVNVASRIEPLAEPGCICVTEQVYDAIRNKPGIETAFLGEKTLKGVDRPVKVYAVTEIRAPLAEATPPVPRPLSRRWLVGAVAALGIAAAASLAVVALFYLLRGPGPEDEAEAEPLLGAKSIAVLPFVNFSDSKDDEYFSDGITDDILTHLSKIGDLRVIARTSVMQYKNTEKRIRDIGRELGVAAILEGSVRRADSRVRVTSQLVDAKTEEHIWAETYDRDLTDIFAIQSDVARKIAAALKAALTPEEKNYIEEKPTDNMEAYDCYLKGNAFFDRSGLENTNNAISMYEKAVELDPTFALAHARLAWAHLQMYATNWGGFDHTDERRAKAKSALDKALVLDPDHPEVHLAYGYYYYHGFRDLARAQEHFTLALQKQPNNSDLLLAIGYVKRRRGRWEEAASDIKRAAELDPRSWHNLNASSHIFTQFRNWAEAERHADRFILIAPNSSVGYNRRANVHLQSKGDIERARGVMAEALEKLGPDVLIDQRSYIEILARDYRKALEIVEADTADRFLRKADIYRYLGQPGSSRAYYDSARVTYEELVSKDPGDYSAHGNLGIAYAGLGRREEAVIEGKLAVEILPLSRDAYSGTAQILTLASIYSMLGEQDAAIDQLELLLSIPSDISVALLKIDPRWDPLREHPRFQALVSGY